MRKNSKPLALSLVIILAMTFTFGCTKDTEEPDANDISPLPTSMTVTAGFLNEKYIEDDIMMLEMGYVQGNNEAFAGNLKLKTEDSDLFDNLNPLEFYIMSYDTNYNLISIEKNQIIRDFVLEGQSDINNSEVEIISAREDFGKNDLTLLNSYSIDIYGDEKEETISMYTDAEKDPEGNIMWDDGQNWTIIVDGNDEAFVLFDDYLQLASLEFFVYTIDDEFYVSTVNSGTANLTMTEYKYNAEDNTFEKTIKSDTDGNVNIIHKSKSGF